MKSKKQTNKEEDEEKKLEGDSTAAEAPAAKPMVRGGRNDCDDAESSSGSEPPSSSSQETSGGAGYSGDYSSISDSSETGGSQSKPETRGGGKKISEPILKNKDGTYAPKRVRRQKYPKKSMDGVDVKVSNEDRSIELMHDYHHHRNHHGRHHRQATGSNMGSLSQDANSDEDINLDINQKISEIMSLYKVSLHAQRDVKNAARAHLKLNAEAAAKQAAKTASSDSPMQVENSQPITVLANLQRNTSQQMPTQEDERKARSGHMDSSDYAHLVEACRPFFNDSRTLMTGDKLPTIEANAGIDEAHSSSGFTSFFTTTNQSGSNSNNTNGSRGSSNDSSNQKKESPQVEETTRKAASQASQMEQVNADNDTSSETSSLVVQARVKRKYKEQSRRTSSSNSDQTNNNKKMISEKSNGPAPSKRVRIEGVALDTANAKSKEKAKSKQQQQRTESSSLSSSISATTETNSAPKALSKKGEIDQSQAKPTIVTESSSGTTTANNSSGSGNDNNTTSKSESGGDGNSDQRKLPGDRDNTSETGAGESQEEQQKPSSSDKPIAKADKPLIHHHHHMRHENKSHGASEEALDHTAAAAAAAAAERQDEEDALVSKEKRSEKKRKRRESRREYEEELRKMRESSENNSDAALEPGMPVTLEEVLSLTKTTRLLVQALPPFLAVHINAAFTNLCGIQSSAIIGRPVSTFISLPSSKEGESSGSDNANSREESDKMSSLSGSADDIGRNGSSSVVAHGARQAGDAAAAAAGEGNFQNLPSPPSGLRIDRLIVARGYGHIHNVELECHRLFQAQPSHAIEGSEVKFIEGNSPSKRRKKTNPKILCRMSVSPVVSTPARNQLEIQPVEGADSNGGTNRRKHRHPAELQSVKHYLIQLEAVNGPRSLVSGSSFTSCATDTTLEAQLLGITKAEVHARRCRLESHPEQNPGIQVQQGDVDQREREESIDYNSSSAMELVVTCG